MPVDETSADRVGDEGEHNRNSCGFLLQSCDDGSRLSENHFRLQRDQLFRERLHLRASGRIAVFDMNISTLRPTQSFQFLLERFYVWIVKSDKHADMPHAVELLGSH